MSNVALEKAMSKPGHIKLGKQTTLNAGNVEDMRRQQACSLGLYAWGRHRAEVGDVGG